ncbi:MAG: FAD-dependent oxidoreductase [Phycisphaerales bacterium JB063]
MIALASLIFSLPAHAQSRTYDIVVYGGSSGGVTAAVQAARMGKSVVLINPYTHLGGMTSSGLGNTDSGRRSVIGGLSLEFYRRIHHIYTNESLWVHERRADYIGTRWGSEGDGTQWGFEPRVAEYVFEQWLEEYDIPLVEARLDRSSGDGVRMDGQRITAIVTEAGDTYHGEMFIDATYEGDLLAAAGVSYTVGREGNDAYNETLNGIQTTRTVHHVFTVEGRMGRVPQDMPEQARVDPYVVPGDPDSGLLPGVNPDAGGNDGDPDHRVQSYCYRLCLTNDPDNRVPFRRPAGYDEATYELLFRMFEAGETRIPWLPGRMPNHKTDTNNRWAVSMNLIGGSTDYPEAPYNRRREIELEHEHWQRGLMWTLANHPRVPEHVRNEVSQWGYAKDEFADNGHWPYMIYIRVARRMVSDYVMTEHDCMSERVCDDSVGMGSYTMDSHNVQRYVTPGGWVQNEGNIETPTPGPYAISYRALIPKRGEAENLLVPWAVSSSHIAFGSIRMEPVFMILGQSAATAAALAIDAGVSVQDLDYETLKARLIADGQILTRPGQRSAVDPDSLPGVVMDDADAEKVGEWTESSTARGYVGSAYLHDGNTLQGQRGVRYTLDLPEPGTYEVRVSYTPNPNRASNTPVTIRHARGQRTVHLDQRRAPVSEAGFASLGRFTFGDQAVITITNHEADGYVIADCIQLLPVP